MFTYGPEDYVFKDEDGVEYISTPDDSWGLTCFGLILIWQAMMLAMFLTLGGVHA